MSDAAAADGSFSVTIDKIRGMHAGTSRRAEATEIMIAVSNALAQMVNGAERVPIVDRAGANIGRLAWTPFNPAEAA